VTDDVDTSPTLSMSDRRGSDNLNSAKHDKESIQLTSSHVDEVV
jgi:hypothetical protein